MALPNKSRRREMMLQVAFLLVFLIAVALLVNALGVFRAKEPGVRRVTYQVFGTTSTGVITYTSEEGDSSGRLETLIPWKLESLRFQPGSMIILTAGNPSQAGEINCTILVDGNPWKQEKATYPQDKVSCAGILP
jgi:hypothetical protein